MKVLAVDIGVGTQDILLYDSRRELENCSRLILPSPTRILASRVERAAAKTGELFLRGCTVGGGPFSRAVKRALAAGKKVHMTPEAAFSIRNNLDDVASLGVSIAEAPPPGFSGTTLELDELDLEPLCEFLRGAGEDPDDPDAVAAAVQDHGAYRAGESNRKTRLRHMMARMREDPRPSSLSYLAHDVPDTFPRMRSAARRLQEQFPSSRVLVMDTSPAAVAGCLADARVAQHAGGNLLLVNAGNGHTLACLLRAGRVVGLLEHHTRRLEAGSFAAYLERFCDGEARDEDPFMAEGHGLFYLGEAPGMKNLDLIAVTGPRRGFLEGAGLGVYYPAPGGDMMMTGPLGLVEAVRRRGEG
ncbi:MAG: pyruvate formate lyase-activating protein [Actinobacteria bacterium]|nr:pyruvate formate lyase-activating protein [Actinomycetota bacterium]